MGSLLTSLEIAMAVTAGLVFFMMFLLWVAQPRLRYRWESSQPALVSIPSASPQELYSYLEQTLGPFGFHPVGDPEGPFIFQPSAFRQKLGSTAITVTFPGADMAVVAGQALFVSKLSPTGQVTFMSEGSIPFRDWLKQRFAVKFSLLAGITFVAIFLVGLNFL